MNTRNKRRSQSGLRGRANIQNTTDNNNPPPPQTFFVRSTDNSLIVDSDGNQIVWK